MLLEIVQLLGRWTFATVEALVRLLVPVAERSVAGDIVLITGCGHGIGREVALQYGRLGAIVVCVDINGATNAETVHQIESAGGRASGFVYVSCRTDPTGPNRNRLSNSRAAATSPIERPFLRSSSASDRPSAPLRSW